MINPASAEIGRLGHLPVRREANAMRIRIGAVPSVNNIQPCLSQMPALRAIKPACACWCTPPARQGIHCLAHIGQIWPVVCNAMMC